MNGHEAAQSLLSTIAAGSHGLSVAATQEMALLGATAVAGIVARDVTLFLPVDRRHQVHKRRLVAYGHLHQRLGEINARTA